MCTGSTAGNVGADVVGGVADYFTGGALTPELVGMMGSQVGQYAQQQALNKQDKITAANILEQGNLNKQAEGDVSSTINKIAASNPEASKAKMLTAENQALQLGAATSASAQPAVPGASKSYKAAVGGANATAGDYINNIKQGMAGTNAPTLQRIGESQDIANTASDIGLLGQQSQRQNYAAQVAEQSVRQNPWLQDLGMTMQAAGTIMGGYQGYTGGQVPWEGAATKAATAAGTANPYISYLNGVRGVPSTFGAMTQAGSGITGAAAGTV
jgi:hypothetical protein